LGAVVDTSTWERPPVFDLLEERGVTRDEMFRVFNMGIGFCLVVDADRVEDVTGLGGSVIGEIVLGSGVRLQCSSVRRAPARGPAPGRTTQRSNPGGTASAWPTASARARCWPVPGARRP